MIIYKTINLITGKIYVGMDSKNNPSYLGSGLHLKRSINKYGRENFVKRILEECDSIKDLSDREIYWINKLDARNPEIGYNIAEGGKGGWLGDDVNEKRKKSLMGHVIADETRIKISKANKGKVKFPNGRKFTEEWTKKISDNHADISGGNNPMYNKQHSDETKELMKQKSKGRFTLDWFIERNGKKEGNLKYQEFKKQCRYAAKKANEKRWGKKDA